MTEFADSEQGRNDIFTCWLLLTLVVHQNDNVTLAKALDLYQVVLHVFDIKVRIFKSIDLSNVVNSNQDGSLRGLFSHFVRDKLEWLVELDLA